MASTVIAAAAVEGKGKEVTKEEATKAADVMTEAALGGSGATDWDFDAPTTCVFDEDEDDNDNDGDGEDQQNGFSDAVEDESSGNDDLAAFDDADEDEFEESSDSYFIRRRSSLVPGSTSMASDAGTGLGAEGPGGLDVVAEEEDALEGGDSGDDVDVGDEDDDDVIEAAAVAVVEGVEFTEADLAAAEAELRVGSFLLGHVAHPALPSAVRIILHCMHPSPA